MNAAVVGRPARWLVATRGSLGVQVVRGGLWLALGNGVTVVSLHSPHWTVTVRAAAALSAVLLGAAFRSHVRLLAR